MKRSNGELKGMARQMLLGRYQVPMMTMILSTLIPSLFLLPFNYLCSGRATYLSQAILYYLAYLLITLIELLLNTGVKRVHLLIARGQNVKVSDMFWVIQNRPDRILIGSLIFAIVSWIPQIPSFLFARMAPEGSSGATVFLITQALSLIGLVLGFLLTLPFYFIFWIYADDPQAGTFDAFRRSLRLLRGAKWQLCVMELSFIGWTMLRILTFGIGSLWVLPYMDQTFTNLYLDLKHEFDVKVTLSSDIQTETAL